MNRKKANLRLAAGIRHPLSGMNHLPAMAGVAAGAGLPRPQIDLPGV